MSFDRRITPVRADLADERLRGQVEAERFTTGTVKRVITTFSPLHRHPSREAAPVVPLSTHASPLVGGAPLCGLSWSGPAWIRTRDRRIMSPLL